MRASISPLALARRLAILSSVSVPRPRNRFSSSSKLGGDTKTYVPGSFALRHCRQPCTSMSRMQILPVFRTDSTAAMLVP